jgi:hypothetical protein
MNPRLKMRGSLAGAVAALTFAVGWCMVRLPILEDRASDSNAKADQALTAVDALQVQADENRRGLLEANRRLKAAGKSPVPVPTVTPVPVPQADSLSAEEYATVRAMIDAEVSKARAPITQAEVTQIARVAATFVPRPRDGKSVTAAELQPLVAVALATYCGEG